MKQKLSISIFAFISTFILTQTTLAAGDGSVDSTVKINDATTNGPVLTDADQYGRSVANIGDLNNDGVEDIAVGAYHSDIGGTNRGVIYIHFMNADGSIDSTVEISDNTANGPVLTDGDRYGISIANIGDLNNDGVQELAVGAYQDDIGGTNRGTLHIHFMNTDGSIDSTVEISDNTANGPVLVDHDYYGASVVGMGDLNDDGVEDIAVGAFFDDANGENRGTVHIHFMNTDGSIDSTIEINDTTANGPDLSNSDYYGISVANIGDLNNDGVQDLSVGAHGDDAGGTDKGAVYIHFMNTDGSIDSTTKIDDTTTNGPVLTDGDRYGVAIANMGDLDGDGVQDLVVGAHADDANGENRGTVHINFINTDGSIDSTIEINDTTVNGPTLSNSDYYGVSVANIGDLNGDSLQDLAVGAFQDDTSGTDDKGAIHIHFMHSTGPSTSTVTTDGATSITETAAIGNGNITDTGGDDPERFIEWGTVSGTYPNECSAGVGGAGAYSCNLTNLIHNTTYYVRSKATNIDGTTYGDETSFTTVETTETVITDPDSTDMQDIIDNNYITVDNGTIDNTTQTTTQVEVTFQSNTTNAIFPTNTIITESGAGSFNFQNFITENTLTEEKVEHPNAIGAVRLGVPNTNLSFSQDITVEIAVSSAFNNMEMDVLFQLEGSSTWNTHTTCIVTNGVCSFTTNHATTYIVNGDGNITGTENLNLTIEVQDTLTLDCYDRSQGTGNTTITLGTAANPGVVTAGTPAVGISSCDVTTNDDQGYYLSMVNDTNGGVAQGGITDVLRHEDPNNPGTWHGITEAGLTPWDWTEATQTGSTTVDWDDTDPTGLGFSVMNIPESSANNPINTNWTTGTSGGTCPEGINPDSNIYAAIPDTTETISAVVAYNATTSTTDVCYKVDVSPSQASGSYEGSVTYTATSDASGYYQ